jgi:hypothetical protein
MFYQQADRKDSINMEEGISKDPTYPVLVPLLIYIVAV